MVDKGFEGKDRHQTWSEHYGARVVCAPKRNSSKPWPKALRRWLASLRQIVETVYDKLLNTFGLARGRPHELSGMRARLAAKVALHNFHEKAHSVKANVVAGCSDAWAYPSSRFHPHSR